MQHFRINYTLRPPGQNGAVIAVAIPAVAVGYAHVDAGHWYVETWFDAEQITEHLVIWFGPGDELRVHELGADEACLNGGIEWHRGHLGPPPNALFPASQRPTAHANAPMRLR
jgi:hypothetical protein